MDEIKFHNPPSNIYTIDKKSINDFLSMRGEGEYLTICSKVILLNEHVNHIPLLDFHVPVSENNQAICEAVLRALDL